MIETTRTARNRVLPMPSQEELTTFLAEARRKTAMQGVLDHLWKAWRKRSHNPASSTLGYTTQSLGFGGRTEHELVSLDQRPIWASNALGGTTDLCTHTDRETVHVFLKGRQLRIQGDGTAPNNEHRFGAFRYVYQEHGTLANGYGEEMLFYDILLIYQINFRHGLIR